MKGYAKYGAFQLHNVLEWVFILLKKVNELRSEKMKRSLTSVMMGKEDT